jgi:hypothetical protein
MIRSWLTQLYPLLPPPSLTVALRELGVVVLSQLSATPCNRSWAASVDSSSSRTAHRPKRCRRP